MVAGVEVVDVQTGLGELDESHKLSILVRLGLETSDCLHHVPLVVVLNTDIVDSMTARVDACHHSRDGFGLIDQTSVMSHAFRGGVEPFTVDSVREIQL